MKNRLRTGQLEDQTRLDAEHLFHFNCSRGLPCFTRCCRDVTVVLTPYDVLRLKKALGISSAALVDQYTLVIPKKDRIIPMVVLKMREEDKRCPFVAKQGCTVYEDRPWACRMYPLDIGGDGTFHLITDASRCMGLSQNQVWRIADWLIEQGVPIYDEVNALFSQITSPLCAEEMDIDNPKIFKMVFMALYNLDRFRDFVFESTFLERFDLAPAAIEKIKRSDLELLKFAFDWIKFGIFGQKTFKVKSETVKNHDPQPQ